MNNRLNPSATGNDAGVDDALLGPLNAPQRQAVTSQSRSLLVLAGAGSGKTRVLAHRIAWLLRSRAVPPAAVLAVTFTNKAAREMSSRIEPLLGDTPFGLWVGTFHSIALRLLKRHWEEAGLERDFQVLGSEDQRRVLRRLANEAELDADDFPPRRLQQYISAQKTQGLRARHVAARAPRRGRGDDAILLRIYSSYEEACRRGALVDFDDLLLGALELWQVPEVLAIYQRRFEHLLVDEFQDTNAIQYNWLKTLAGDRAQLFAVGDDDQSIYGWRGARVENLRGLEQDFSGTEIVRLEQNYRSTAPILNAANAVIGHNSQRLGKQLWTDVSAGEPPALYRARDEEDEARFVAERARALNERDGEAWQNIAVLYRTSAQSRRIESTLRRLAVPYRVHGGQRFYERQEVRDTLAYLRLVRNRHDDASFDRVVNTPRRGLGDTTLEQLRAAALERGLPLWQAVREQLAAEAVAPRAAAALADFAELLQALSQEAAELPLDLLIERVLDRSGLMEYYGNASGARRAEQLLDRRENLRELVVASRGFMEERRHELAREGVDGAEEDPGTTLQAFIDSTALDAGDMVAEGSAEHGVQLMTLHAAKGLEFPVVFILGLEEELFPHILSMSDPEKVEEERRLCYVGYTRAMRLLYLCTAEVRSDYGGAPKQRRPSRFLEEVPPELLREIRAGAPRPMPPSRGATHGHRRSAAVASSRGQPPRRSSAVPPRASILPAPVPEHGFSLGQLVCHERFGPGVIELLEGLGAGARARVNFEHHGGKWLVLSYAKLKPQAED